MATDTDCIKRLLDTASNALVDKLVARLLDSKYSDRIVEAVAAKVSAKIIDTLVDRERDTDVDRGSDKSSHKYVDPSFDRGSDKSSHKYVDPPVDRGSDTDVDRGSDKSSHKYVDPPVDRGSDTDVDPSFDRGSDKSSHKYVDPPFDREMDTDVDRGSDKSSHKYVDPPVDRESDKSSGKCVSESGRVLEEKVYTIINAVNTTGHRGKGSWIGVWRTATGHPRTTQCAVAGCPGDIRYGGHVLIDGLPKRMFILPLCATCNHTRSYLDYEWRKTRKITPVEVPWHRSVPMEMNTPDTIADRPVSSKRRVCTTKKSDRL